MFRRHLIWQGLEQTAWAVGCLVAIALAATLIVLLMRYERTLVPRRVGWILLGFRLVVLGLLAAMLLQPILSWTLDLTTSGRVAIAIDVSDSMTTADHHASPAEKLRWARALGLIGNDANNERLDRWIRAYEAGQEPEWVDANDPANVQQREQLSAARRDNLHGVFAEVDKIPRKEIARRLLQSIPDPLLPRLAEVANVQMVAFGGRSATMEPETARKMIDAPPATVQSSQSDLAQALNSAATTGGGNEKEKLLGVVLLTDGRDNSGRNLIEVGERFGAATTPIFPVLFGSAQAPRDLSIAGVEYPQTVSKSDTPLITATLACAGFAGEEIEVRLERENAEPVIQKVTPRGQTAEVKFQLEASTLGRHSYTLRTEARPGETRADNNSRMFAVNVIDDKIHVLLVDGDARWEFRYIDSALSRDANVELKSVLFKQPYIGVLDSTFFERDLPAAAQKEKESESSFNGNDVVILGDVAPEDISAETWEQLDRFVSDEAGTLVCVAGKQHFPLEFASPVLERMLPVTGLHPVRYEQVDLSVPPTTRGFHLALTPETEKEAMFQFDVEPQANRDIWSSLPGFSWGIVGEPKPAATVFARTLPIDADIAKAAADRSPGINDAVIAHHYYGAGQVLYVGFDSTWRWRHRVGDIYHHRFWGQLARWAAENKAAAGNEFVQFGPVETDVEAGSDVVARARWSRNFLKRFPELTARVEVYRADAKPEDKPLTIVPLKPVDHQPTVHEAHIAALPVGDYRLKLSAEHAELGAAEISAPVYVTTTQTPELADVAANPQLLTQIAQASHGKLLLPDQIHELPDLLKQPEQTMFEEHTFELWNHWIVMVLFFSLLTGEWIVRKLNGLP